MIEQLDVQVHLAKTQIRKLVWEAKVRLGIIPYSPGGFTAYKVKCEEQDGHNPKLVRQFPDAKWP